MPNCVTLMSAVGPTIGRPWEPPRALSEAPSALNADGAQSLPDVLHYQDEHGLERGEREGRGEGGGVKPAVTPSKQGWRSWNEHKCWPRVHHRVGGGGVESDSPSPPAHRVQQQQQPSESSNLPVYIHDQHQTMNGSSNGAKHLSLPPMRNLQSHSFNVTVFNVASVFPAESGLACLEVHLGWGLSWSW